MKRMQLRYAGHCCLCGTEITKDTWALYDRATKTVRWLTCPKLPQELKSTQAAAGGSARREFERRKAAREERVKGRVGNFLGGVILALTDEPQSTRAWERGAIGEEKLGEALEGVDGLQVLH